MSVGYWRLRDGLLILLLGVPVAVGVRFVELFLSAPQRGSVGATPLVSWFGSCVFLLAVAFALVKCLSGAVSLARKPGADNRKGLQIGLCVSAFLPVVNLFVFSPLLSLYTFQLGKELAKPSIRRAGWILCVCSLALIVPTAFAIRAGMDYAFEDHTTPTRGSSNEPMPVELLLGGGVGAILWLAAYIVTTMTLSGVARAVERAIRVAPFNDPEAHFAQLKDALRSTENRDTPT